MCFKVEGEWSRSYLLYIDLGGDKKTKRSMWICLLLINITFLSYGQEISDTASSESTSEKVAVIGKSGDTPVPLRFDFWKGIHIGDRRVKSREDKEELKKVLATCPHAREEYRSSETLFAAGYVFLTIGALCNVWGLTTMSGPDYNIVPNICGIAAFGISIPFAIGATTKQKNAVSMYNNRQCTGEHRGAIQFRKTR
ncbi:MAG: hypothetical protein ACLFQB_15465 [Chitinispirillaceae bacterium]